MAKVVIMGAGIGFDGQMHFTEFDEDGNEEKTHELRFVHSMILPDFKGVDTVMDIEGLANPRGLTWAGNVGQVSAPSVFPLEER